MATQSAGIMRIAALAKASVPVTYVRLGLEIAEDRGLMRTDLVRGLGLAPGVLDRPEARISLIQSSRLIARVWRATGDASLGYEFGLRSSLTAHGSLGYGLMSHTRVGEALAFGLRYGRLCNPVIALNLHQLGDQAVIEARPALPLGRMRQLAIDAVLVAVARLARQLGGAFRPELELCFACEEPQHYARYRDRLPPVRFSAGADQLRFPAAYLSRPLATGNRGSADLMEAQCRRELALIADRADVVEQVRALLQDDRAEYPDLQIVAQQLHLSGRTLKRRLQDRQLSFQALLEEARRCRSQSLLGDRSLSVQQVAARVGYQDPASFTRAFRKWTGLSPRQWRDRIEA